MSNFCQYVTLLIKFHHISHKTAIKAGSITANCLPHLVLKLYNTAQQQANQNQIQFVNAAGLERKLNTVLYLVIVSLLFSRVPLHHMESNKDDMVKKNNLNPKPNNN